MADGTIAIDEPSTVDKMLDTESLTVGANTVQRERVVIAGLAAADLCPVDATAGVKVNLGADNDVTVTGTVTANLSATDNAVLDTIDANTDFGVVVGGGVEATALRVTLASDSTGVVSVDDNGSTISIDDGGGAITVDGTVAVTNAGLTALNGAISGTEIQADVLTVPAPLSTTGAGTEAAALRVTIATDSTGVLSVDDNGGALTVDGTVTANLAAGTNNIGDVDILTIAAGDNNIGNVDIVTMPNVTLAAGTNTNEVVGDAAHDAAIAGNPVSVGGAAQASDDTAPPNRVSAEGDIARFATDFDGAQYVRPHGPQVWSYHANGSSALTDASVHATPGAGLSLYVTDIIVSSGAATAMNVFFEEGSTTVLGPWYLEAVAGRGLEIHFVTPKKITANTALTVTTSAAIAHSVDVTGFTAQG